jgi:hypothetical protein
MNTLIRRFCYSVYGIYMTLFAWQSSYGECDAGMSNLGHEFGKVCTQSSEGLEIRRGMHDYVDGWPWTNPNMASSSNVLNALRHPVTAQSSVTLCHFQLRNTMKYWNMTSNPRRPGNAQILLFAKLKIFYIIKMYIDEPADLITASESPRASD